MTYGNSCKGDKCNDEFYCMQPLTLVKTIIINIMNSQISLKKINDILELNFFIPSYQRGYRWTEQQVNDLLNDIWEFINKSNKQQGEFYCLQPIVVKTCTEEFVQTNQLKSSFDNNRWYEVIDGQQRLTTIFIILSYLEKFLGEETLSSSYGKSKFVLEYETRSETREYLNNITNNHYIGIDSYFIHNAYTTTESWFKSHKQPKVVRDAILNAFMIDDDNKYPAEIIWYELSSSDDPIGSFIRLNVGKIPLTNAELIKALFLQERNFGNEVELRQLEIAKEWDSIEYALQKNNFWAFLNETDYNIPARIEFLFEVMYKVAKKDDSEADNKYGTDQYATFRFFNKKFDPSGNLTKAVENSWNEIKDYFSAFEDWYNDNEWYHYIGYLIWAGTSIVDIYSLYKKSSKTEFKAKLIELVKEQIGNIEYHDNNGNCKVSVSYGTDKKTLRSLLLLYNIEFILQKKEYDYYRFPFDLFKSEKWDIEHISSQTTNELKDKNAQEEWLKVALDALDDNTKKEFEDEIRSSSADFNLKRKWITQKVGEENIDEDFKNCIGNLTLLNATINRSYGNAIFPAKRKVIIKHDKIGSFIPLCTKNVFLKYLTEGNNLRWSENDIQISTKHFVEILSKYLIKK